MRSPVWHLPMAEFQPHTRLLHGTLSGNTPVIRSQKLLFTAPANPERTSGSFSTGATLPRYTVYSSSSLLLTDRVVLATPSTRSTYQPGTPITARPMQLLPFSTCRNCPSSLYSHTRACRLEAHVLIWYVALVVLTLKVQVLSRNRPSPSVDTPGYATVPEAPSADAEAPSADADDGTSEPWYVDRSASQPATVLCGPQSRTQFQLRQGSVVGEDVGFRVGDAVGPQVGSWRSQHVRSH